MGKGKVEEYLISKGLEYRHNGNQLQLEQCPFCLRSEYKFFINDTTWGFDCKHGKCQRQGGEWVFKNNFGDRVEKKSSVSEETTNYSETGEIEREGIPDVAKMHEHLMDNPHLVAHLEDSRGWTVETLKDMQIGIANRWMPDIMQELPCFSYPYFQGKNCTFVKFRSIPTTQPGLEGYKGFSAIKGRDVPLYNNRCVSHGMDYLILVEGEADTISVVNAGEKNVCGVPGAGLKKITWDKLLDMPKKLFLMFDNDEAGQKGAKEFAERFGVEKFLNIVLPELDLLDPITEGDKIRTKTKDITEFLQNGGTLEDLQQMMRDAVIFDVEGVSPIDQSLDKVRHNMEERGTNLPKYTSPWASLNARMGGADDGYLIVLQAPKKTGKTTLALNWADYFVQQGHTTYFECLEMTDEQLAKKWASYIMGADDTPGKSQVTPDVLIAAKKIARGREAQLLFGAAQYHKLEEVFDRWRSVIRRYGAKVMIFDNLQLLCDLLYKPSMGNRVAFLSQLTKKFKAFAMEMKILFILIAQSKRVGEDYIADADTLEGSSGPGNDCDIMITANRTKQLSMKKESDLRKAVQIESTATLDPILYMDVGLSRYAPGGVCRLHIDGAISKITELSNEFEQELRQDESGRIGGIKFESAVEAGEVEEVSL